MVSFKERAVFRNRIYGMMARWVNAEKGRLFIDAVDDKNVWSDFLFK